MGPIGRASSSFERGQHTFAPPQMLLPIAPEWEATGSSASCKDSSCWPPQLSWSSQQPRGGVLKNTGVFFEDCGSHTCAPSRAILGRPLPNPCCLIGHRVRHTATPPQRVGGVHRRPPRTLPSEGRGREWATGTGEAAPRRARDPKPRVRMNLALRRWQSRAGGGRGGGFRCGL